MSDKPMMPLAAAVAMFESERDDQLARVDRLRENLPTLVDETLSLSEEQRETFLEDATRILLNIQWQINGLFADSIKRLKESATAEEE